MFKLYSEIKYIFPSTAGAKPPPPTTCPRTALGRRHRVWCLESSSSVSSIQHGAGKPDTHTCPRRAAWHPAGGAAHNPDNT